MADKAFRAGQARMGAEYAEYATLLMMQQQVLENLLSTVLSIANPPPKTRVTGTQAQIMCRKALQFQPTRPEAPQRVGVSKGGLILP